jgi:hypothetical protein
MGCNFQYYKNNVLIGDFQYYKSIQDIHCSCNSWMETDINEFKSGLKCDISSILQKISDLESLYKKTLEECKKTFLHDTFLDLKRASKLVQELMFNRDDLKLQKEALEYYENQLKFIIENEIDRVYVSF